jgi:hypothetical protein
METSISHIKHILYIFTEILIPDSFLYPSQLCDVILSLPIQAETIPQIIAIFSVILPRISPILRIQEKKSYLSQLLSYSFKITLTDQF